MRDGEQISMYIIKPKDFQNKKAAAYFYAHGGGGWALTAKHFEPAMATSTLNLECVLFSIDYRLAPEHKCPGGQQDFVDCMNYVLANPDKYGIDPAKTCMAGCSGGGWIVAGAANLLAKSNDLGKVRALFIHTGNLSNAANDVPEDQWEHYDKDYDYDQHFVKSCFNACSGFDENFNNMYQDDQLFPGRASDQILKKYPPTVIWTSEFDFLRRDNETFAARLKGLGKLAAMSNMPGVTHGYHQMEESQEVTWFQEEEKLAFTSLVDY